MAKIFPPKSAIWAAGGVVTRTRKGRREYLLVHRPRYNDWSLPKGKLDRKESFETAALREIEEETGRDCRVVAPVGTVAYRTPRRNFKVVRYWLMEATGGRFSPNREVDKVVWLTVNKAKLVMSYNRDRTVLDWAHTLAVHPKSSRVFLVRHANAGTRSDSKKGDDSLRPLSKKGRRQAAAITTALTRVPVTGVYTSEFKRCVQTVNGLAKSTGQTLKVDKALTEGAPLRKLQARIAQLRGEARVMCSHGDEISAYIESLADDGVTLVGGLRWQKGSIWHVDLFKGEVKRAVYAPSQS